MIAGTAGIQTLPIECLVGTVGERQTVDFILYVPQRVCLSRFPQQTAFTLLHAHLMRKRTTLQPGMTVLKPSAVSVKSVKSAGVTAFLFSKLL